MVSWKPLCSARLYSFLGTTSSERLPVLPSAFTRPSPHLMAQFIHTISLDFIRFTFPSSRLSLSIYSCFSSVSFSAPRANFFSLCPLFRLLLYTYNFMPKWVHPYCPFNFPFSACYDFCSPTPSSIRFVCSSRFSISCSIITSDPVTITTGFLLAVSFHPTPFCSLPTPLQFPR